MDANLSTALPSVEPESTAPHATSGVVVPLRAAGERVRRAAPEASGSTSHAWDRFERALPPPAAGSVADASAECAELERLADMPLDRYQLDDLFQQGCSLAQSGNDFVRYRACVQLLALGRRDLRFDERASLTVAAVASRSGRALKGRLMNLLA